MTLPDSIKEEIEKEADMACQKHCGHDGTYSCYVCEGRHKELYIIAATQFYERGFKDGEIDGMRTAELQFQAKEIPFSGKARCYGVNFNKEEIGSLKESDKGREHGLNNFLAIENWNNFKRDRGVE